MSDEYVRISLLLPKEAKRLNKRVSDYLRDIKSLSPSKLELFRPQIGEAKVENTIAPAEIVTPLASPLSGETPHPSIPLLKVQLVQELESIDPDLRESSVYTDSDKPRMLPHAIRIIHLLGQIEAISPDADISALSEQIQDTQSNYSLAPIVTAIRSGSLGDNVTDLYNSIVEPAKSQACSKCLIRSGS